MTSDDLAGLLAHPGRMRVLAAIALGAGTDAEAAAVAGLSVRLTAQARQRLVDGGLVVAGADGLAVAYDALVALVRARSGDRAAEDGRLGAFLVGRRLRSLPAQQSRRQEVLAAVAAAAFEPGRDYDEPAVNELLREWCEGGDVDHAALRRYLVEGGLVERGGGVYRLPSAQGSPEPSPGERRVRAMGLS